MYGILLTIIIEINMTSYDKHEDLGTILMRVIRTLSEITDSGEEREEEKRELERQFRQSDQKLDSLVLQHHKDLQRQCSYTPK